MNDATVAGVSTIEEAASRILQMDEPPQEELPSEEPVAEVEEETESVEAAEEAEETEQVEPETEDGLSELDELNAYLNEAKESWENIRIPTKVNGKEGQATLSELVRAYQIDKSVDQKAESLATARKEFEAERQRITTEHSQQLEQAKGLINTLEQQYLAEFQQVDWQALREQDPAEFSARRQELLERQSRLEAARDGITKQQYQSYMENMQKHLEEQQKLIPELIPEWSDESVAKQEREELGKYLESEGMPREAIYGKLDNNGNLVSPGIADALAIKIARKAMLYDKGAKQVDVTKKKVRSVPKVTRPGKPATKTDIANDALKKKRSQLKKSGKVEDAASLIYDILGG